MKALLRFGINLSRPLLIFALSLFFDKKYLTGRHFNPGIGGFVWAFRAVWVRNILCLAPAMPWPMALTSFVSNPKNISFHPDNLDNFQSPGTYFQNLQGFIRIGEGTYIAPNVGIITSNHSLNDLDAYDEGRDVVIGINCWIGMNAVILPGVVLGDRTIVAAGAVVTKSFQEGHVTIGGVPARLIRRLD